MLKRAHEHVRKEKTFQPNSSPYLTLFLGSFFPVTSFGFLTVKVSAFPSPWKADYSFSVLLIYYLSLSGTIQEVLKVSPSQEESLWYLLTAGMAVNS